MRREIERERDEKKEKRWMVGSVWVDSSCLSNTPIASGATALTDYSFSISLTVTGWAHVPSFSRVCADTRSRTRVISFRVLLLFTTLSIFLTLLCDA